MLASISRVHAKQNRSSNMLYPKEDPSSNVLMFACRSCQYSEPATAACIYRNALQEQIAETAGNVEDVAQDPTVSDSAHHHADSVMQDQYEDMNSEGDDIPEMCTLCGQEILCPFCGQPSDGHMALEVDDPDSAQNGEQEEELVKAEQRERAVSSVAS
jgi:DNA-directed RNA polymerase II subunit RPB9